MISSSKRTVESELEATEVLERSDGSDGSEGSYLALLAIAEHSDTRSWPQLRLPRPPYGLIHRTFPGP